MKPTILNSTGLQFKASNTKAVLFLIVPVILMVTGVYLSYSPIWSVAYVTGQLFLGLFFFQCFILLHETGHFSYFKNRFANIFFGNLFAFISFIPFSSWINIHNLHHKWTGYRDKDPTTEGTVSPKFNALTKLLVNISWLIWFPLFTIGYRIGNYWNISKLKKHILPIHLSRIYRNILLQLIFYIPVFYFQGHWIVHHLLLGYFISLIISDVFILSQHSHIEIPIAGDQIVKPIRYAEQLKYTRSIGFSNFLEKFIFFNFNLHESHHFQPGLPAYYLDGLQVKTTNKVNLFKYLFDAKSMRGMFFIFGTSKKRVGFRNNDKSSSGI